MRKKKNYDEQNFRNNYYEVFNNVKGFILGNCYLEDSTVEKIKLGEFEISTELEWLDVIREIKKQLIIQKLFITGIKKESNIVVIETTDDIYSLLFVHEILDSEDVLEDNEFKKIMQEVDEETQQLDSSEIKLNVKSVGRKAYANKEVIAKIYELYLKGTSLQKIANELNRLEIKNNRGKDWSKSSIRYILLNDKNITSAFIDKDTFNRTVKLMNDNKK